MRKDHQGEGILISATGRIGSRVAEQVFLHDIKSGKKQLIFDRGKRIAPVDFRDIKDGDSGQGKRSI